MRKILKTRHNVDCSKARRFVFPNLRPTTETVTLDMPVILIAQLKSLANRRDVPYQSLMKNFLAERAREEIKK